MCTFCGIEKPLTKTYFEKARVRKDGSIALRAKCIECRRKDLYKWRKENPEKNKAHIKKWHDNNKEHTKKWREENKEHLDKYKENWRNENREYTRDKAKEYREENPEKIEAYTIGRGKELMRVYREKNREELREKAKIYNKAGNGGSGSASFAARSAFASTRFAVEAGARSRSFWPAAVHRRRWPTLGIQVCSKLVE